MMDWFVVIIGAALNRLRGWGPSGRVLELATSKYVIAVVWALMFGLLTQDWVIGLIIGSGVALWSGPGWGNYFDFSTKPNDEVGFIDRLVRDLFSPSAGADIVSMSLRGFLFMFPAFAGLAIYQFSPMPLLMSCVMLSQGLVYYVFHRIDPDDVAGVKTVGAELTIGSIIAAAFLASAG